MKKKSIIIIMVLLILICIAGFFAYAFLSDDIDMFSREITSEDGKYSMNVPYSWHSSTGASPNAVLAAENKDNSMYAVVSVNKNTEGNNFTIEEYIYDYIKKINDNSDDPLVQMLSVAPTQGKLGDNTGYYFEIDTMSDGLALHLWDFVFVADGGYVHVDVASAGEQITSSAEMAKGIISSVKFNAKAGMSQNG